MSFHYTAPRAFRFRPLNSHSSNAGLSSHFGWYEKPGSLCIAMEYLKLGDLDTHVRKTLLQEDESKVIASQILEGVEWMHNKSIAHRDLKPGVGIGLHWSISKLTIAA